MLFQFDELVIDMPFVYVVYQILAHLCREIERFPNHIDQNSVDFDG